jgi:hypothetical protein
MAGPAFAAISSDVPHIQVREETSARASFAVAWSHGIEIPLVPARFGLRLQGNVEWLGANWHTHYVGPMGSLGGENQGLVMRRFVPLFGVWVQP